MVLDHISEGSGGVVIGAAFFDSHGFACGDLDVIDEAVVPEWFEDGVCEAQHHDVLGCFFTQVMVDAVDGVFLEDIANGFVERVSGGLVFSEGFFDDDARPCAVGCAVEFVFFQQGEDACELAWGDAEIEETVSCGAEVCVVLCEAFCEGGESLFAPELALVVVDAAGEIVPDGRVCALTGEFLGSFEEFCAERFVGFVAAGESDDAGRGWQFSVHLEVVEGGHEFSGGQVAGGTENDDVAGFGVGPVGEAFSERVHGGVMISGWP